MTPKNTKAAPWESGDRQNDHLLASVIFSESNIRHAQAQQLTRRAAISFAMASILAPICFGEAQNG